MSTAYHVPVLFDAALDGLDLQPAGTFVDCTFGGGGHSRGVLDRIGEAGRLYAFDCDPNAADNIPDDLRFHLIPENFRFATNFLRLQGIRQEDGILADLGVSSHQFDAEERGFSTRGDGDLDMRMDPDQALDAAGLLDRLDQKSLVRILRRYGEEVQLRGCLLFCLALARLLWNDYIVWVWLCVFIDRRLAPGAVAVRILWIVLPT